MPHLEQYPVKLNIRIAREDADALVQHAERLGHTNLSLVVRHIIQQWRKRRHGRQR